MNPFDELRLKAENGDSAAQLALAEVHYNSQAPGTSPAQALEWFRKAAEQGLNEARYKLGLMFQLGFGVEKDGAEAVKWLRQAAEQGHPVAQNQLAWMYSDGQDIEKDQAEAMRWFRKAAEQGSSPAQYNLGTLYAKGQGSETDDAEAVVWLRKAADQGHPAAQYDLGGMYAEGRGVEQDDATAVEWFRKAADQGYAAAHSNLQRWPKSPNHDGVKEHAVQPEQDLGAIIKASHHEWRVLGIYRVELGGSNLCLIARIARPFQRSANFKIVCVNAVDYSIRPRNPAIIEGGPEMAIHEDHPLLRASHLQLVPGGDGEVFRPPLKLKLLLLDQSHVIADRFEIHEVTANRPPA